MRLIFAFLIFSQLSYAAPRVYRGEIDFSSNNVTTAYEQVLSIPRRAKYLLCNHSHTAGLYFSITGQESDCSDANDDFRIGADGGFGVDEFPLGGSYVCVKTVSGTASANAVNCTAWWDGTPG